MDLGCQFCIDTSPIQIFVFAFIFSTSSIYAALNHYAALSSICRIILRL